MMAVSTGLLARALLEAGQVGSILRALEGAVRIVNWLVIRVS